MSAMKTISGWDGKTEPKCTDTAALSVGDALLSGAGFFLLLVAFDTKPGEDPNAGLAVAGGSTGLLFALSAFYGEHASDECKSAKMTWKVHEATAKP